MYLVFICDNDHNERMNDGFESLMSHEKGFQDGVVIDYIEQA